MLEETNVNCKKNLRDNISGTSVFRNHKELESLVKRV